MLAQRPGVMRRGGAWGELTYQGGAFKPGSTPTQGREGGCQQQHTSSSPQAPPYLLNAPQRFINKLENAHDMFNNESVQYHEKNELTGSSASWYTSKRHRCSIYLGPGL